MYDIRWIRENADAFDRGLASRGLAPLSSHLLALDEARTIDPDELKAIGAGLG